MLSEQAQRHVSRVKRLDMNCHVSGKFDDLVPSEDGSRRQQHVCVFGTVIAAVDYNRYHVLFENNEVKECYSNSLRVDAATASLPLDVPPLHQIGSNLKKSPILTNHYNPNSLIEENGASGLKNIDEIRSLPASVWPCKLFLMLFLGDSLQAKVQQMNESIRNQRSTKCKVLLKLSV